MQLTIERSALLKALGHVQSVVERRNTIPILSNVLLSAGRDRLAFAATDLDMEMVDEAEAQVQVEGQITAPAHTLYEIVRKLPEGAEVSLLYSGDDPRLVVSAGRSRFNLPVLPAGDFPVMSTDSAGASYVLPKEDLARLIDKTRFAVSTEETRYYLNGLYLHTVAEAGIPLLRAVATDGHRLALAQSSLDTEVPARQEVILPRKTVLELQRLLKADTQQDAKAASGADGETNQAAAIEMKFAHNQAKFTFSGMEFVTKLVEGKFPDYNRVIPKNHKNSVTLGRQPLLSSLQRAAILTSEKFKGVRVNLEPGSLRIGASNAEQEEAKEEIEVDYEGDAIDIGFNVNYLIDALGNMDAEMVRIDLQDGNASALITLPDRPGFKYVVMPMRI